MGNGQSRPGYPERSRKLHRMPAAGRGLFSKYSCFEIESYLVSSEQHAFQSCIHLLFLQDSADYSSSLSISPAQHDGYLADSEENVDLSSLQAQIKQARNDAKKQQKRKEEEQETRRKESKGRKEKSNLPFLLLLLLLLRFLELQQ